MCFNRRRRLSAHPLGAWLLLDDCALEYLRGNRAG